MARATPPGVRANQSLAGATPPGVTDHLRSSLQGSTTRDRDDVGVGAAGVWLEALAAPRGRVLDHFFNLTSSSFVTFANLSAFAAALVVSDCARDCAQVRV